MGRRKGVPNKASRNVRGKAVKMESNANTVDRNRASPTPLIKLCKTGLTTDQRTVVELMGQGTLLNIKCEDLHNPLVSWFARCYVPAKRAFVVPCRGVIPLSEESVELMTGLPRGPLEVKYEVNFDLEQQISSRLFPGQGSRPSTSYVAKKIAQYQLADDTFKELWMVHTVSSVLAPTLDNHISNKCYSILPDIGRAQEMNLCKFVADQLHEHFSSGKFGRGCLLYCMLRYITSINTDHLMLDLEDSPYAINSWTTIARDCVAALDTQEYDSTKFGVMQLKDEFKDVLSRELGLFGGPEGFESWMTLNIHPTSTNEQRKRAYSLMFSFASTLNGALSNVVQGLTESVPCERCAQHDAMKPPESEGEQDDRNNDNFDSGADADADQSTSANDDEEGTDAGTNANANRDDEPSGCQEKQTHDHVIGSTSSHSDGENETNMKEARITTPGSTMEAGISSTPSPAPIHSQINVPSDSELFGSNGSGQIGGFVGDSQVSSSQFVDDEIRGVTANLVSNLNLLKSHHRGHSDLEIEKHEEIKIVVAKELDIPLRIFKEAQEAAKERNIVDSEHSVDGGSVQYDVDSSLVDLQWPAQNPVPTGTSSIYNAPQYNPLHKRKRQFPTNSSPARKSPRFSEVGSPTQRFKQHVYVKGRGKTSSVSSPSRKSPRFSQVRVDSDAVSTQPVGSQAVMKQDGQGSGKISLPLSPSRRSPRLSQVPVDREASSTPPVRVPSVPQGDSSSGKTSSVPEADGSSARAAVVLSPIVTSTPKESSERDGSSVRRAVLVSPTITNLPKGTVERDGSSASTAFVLSPTVSGTHKPSISVSKMQEGKDGKRITSAIPISPTVNEPNIQKNICKDIVVSPKTQQRNDQGSSSSQSPFRFSPLFGPHLLSLDPRRHSPMSVHPDVVRLVKSLTDSANKKGLFSSPPEAMQFASSGSGSKRKHTDIVCSSSSKKRDDRPGMFTPPPFDLFGNTQESSSLDNPIDADPLAWAPSQDDFVGNEEKSTDDDLEEFKMSDELSAFILGEIPELPEHCNAELHRYEEYIKVFSSRKRVLEEKAIPVPAEGVRSATPKVKPHVIRVKKASRFNQSPYDGRFVVNKEHDVLYNLILKHKTVRGKESESFMKSYRIIAYKNSFAYTQDLANSVKVRGELSNSCMDVGIEDLQNTNTIKEKLIMTHQITKYIMNGEFLKPIVVSTFKRTETNSLSIMKQILFLVLHEIAPGQEFGNHWYCLSLNIEAERFEALDSLRGEGNIGLIAHANGLIKRIKELWAKYYVDSKIKIQHYDLKIIDVPKQHGNHDCGYHVLFNIENWDGQNIPPIGKNDVDKLRKIFPFKWANAGFNLTKDWRWHLENNI